MSHNLALKIEQLTKIFHVPHSEHGLAIDPRREQINRRWDRLYALRKIDLEIPKGQSIGLIGYNGSGKSTLLKILAGVTSADGGGFEFQGRVGALLELGAGFHPELTGVQNVFLNGAVMGMDRCEINRILPSIIEFAELERFMDMPVKHYSSGMVTRLGFAMATRLKPDVLLLDETFAVGDVRFQIRAIEHLRELQSKGVSLVIVSHNGHILTTLVDRIAWIDGGRIREDGPSVEMATIYRQSLELKRRQGDLQETGIGAGSLFLVSDPDASIVALGAIGATIDSKPAAPGPDGAVAVENGQIFGLTVELLHPGPHPEEALIEFAWVRTGEFLGGSVPAQSRTPVQLDPGPRTRLSLDFGPMDLVEACFSLVAAVSPPSENWTAPDRPEWDWLHFDRRADALSMRIATPTPYDSPMILTLPCAWSAGGGETPSWPASQIH